MSTAHLLAACELVLESNLADPHAAARAIAFVRDAVSAHRGVAIDPEPTVKIRPVSSAAQNRGIAAGDEPRKGVLR